MNILTTLAQYTTYTTQTTSYTSEDAAAYAAAIFLVMLPVVLFAALISYVINGVFLGMVFKKAGLAQWPAWVPFYNTWKFFEIGGQHGALSLLMLIPIAQFVGAVFYFIAAYHIGLKLGKTGVFVLLAIFFQIIWLIWLAVDGSKWDDTRSTAPSRATGPIAQPVATV